MGNPIKTATDWIKDKFRVVGSAGAALGAVLFDFQWGFINRMIDLFFMVILFLLIWPLLWKHYKK